MFQARQNVMFSRRIDEMGGGVEEKKPGKIIHYYSVLSRNLSAWISERSFLIFLSIFFFSNIQIIDMFKWMADNEVLFHRTHPSHMQIHQIPRQEDSGKDGHTVVWRWRSQVAEEARQSCEFNSARVYVSHPSAWDLKGKDPVKRLSVATVVRNIDIDCTEFRAFLKFRNVLTCPFNNFLLFYILNKFIISAPPNL
ncbi:hypothetical protein B9Z55_027980 [Caenorhabditis nigoni]|nr:hypothetical protein B9Z55_027980 [Caenorhabditis nigoni]